MRPLPEHVVRNAVAGAVVSVFVTLLFASLATSRADGHLLSPTALAVFVGVAAGVGVLIGWPNGLYRGAAELLRGDTSLVCTPGCASDPADDPWRPRELWRTTATWAAMVAVWAGAGGALAAVALDGRRARFFVVFVVLAGLAGTAGVVVDSVARHRGAHGARRVAGLEREQVGIRRRGWLQVALPIGLTQLFTNAAVSWILFHDYAVHATGQGDKVLTGSVALADVVVLITVQCALFGSLTTQWGNVDVRLGRVFTNDDAQRVSSKSLVGAQGILYVGIVGLLLGKLVSAVLPDSPTLLQVACARGGFAGLLAFAAAGAGYVRGAMNGRAEVVETPTVPDLRASSEVTA